MNMFGRLDVFRPGFDRDFHDSVLVGLVLRHDDDSFLFELKRHTIRCAQIAAGPLEDFLDFSAGTIPVIGDGLAHDGHAASAVPFIEDILVTRAFQFAGALFDSLFDRVLGHVVGLGLVDGQS